MGRRYPYLLRQQSYIRIEEGGDPGCIWGLLRLLNYHRNFKTVRKIFPKKTKKSTKNNRDKQKASHRLKNAADDEPNHVQTEWVNPPETGSVSKRSFKTRIRELLAKEESSRRRASYLPEQSDHGGCKAYSSSKDNKSLEDVNILDLFKVNEQVFLKMLSEHELHNQGRLTKLTKSGSFPSAQMRDWGPRKLEDKQREIWPPNTKPEGIQPTATSKGRLRSMRRATSLTESMDWYPQLYGSTFTLNRDIKRNLSCSSLKVLFNENDDQTTRFRRRLSLPECDYEEALFQKLEISRQAVTKDSAEPCEDVINEEVNEEISQIGEKDDIELSIEKLEDEDSNGEFHYVKLVLELSGLTAKEQTWVWYTIEQPLNPSVFEDIEKQYYPFEPLERSTRMEDSKWDRMLIFGLINEALVEIDERSCLYYPRALSLSCHVHSIPKGERLLEEAWSFVGRCLSWRPELDPSLDFAVAQDLNGRNGWMNLQIESECVALELEDMILDDLLDDILHSCS